MQVKIFGGTEDRRHLEAQINAWLAENPHVSVYDSKFGYAAISRWGAEGWYSAMLLYASDGSTFD